MSAETTPVSPTRKARPWHSNSRSQIRSMIIKPSIERPKVFVRRVKSEPIICSWDFQLPKERHNVSSFAHSNRLSKLQRRSELAQALSFLTQSDPPSVVENPSIFLDVPQPRVRSRRGSKRERPKSGTLQAEPLPSLDEKESQNHSTELQPSDSPPPPVLSKKESRRLSVEDHKPGSNESSPRRKLHHHREPSEDSSASPRRKTPEKKRSHLQESHESTLLSRKSQDSLPKKKREHSKAKSTDVCEGSSEFLARKGKLVDELSKSKSTTNPEIKRNQRDTLDPESIRCSGSNTPSGTTPTTGTTPNTTPPGRSRSNSADISDSIKEKRKSTGRLKRKVPGLQIESKPSPELDISDEDSSSFRKKSPGFRFGDYFGSLHMKKKHKENSPTTEETKGSRVKIDATDDDKLKEGRYLSRNRSVSDFLNHALNPGDSSTSKRTLKRSNTADSSLKSRISQNSDTQNVVVEKAFLARFLLNHTDEELSKISISNLLEAIIRGLHKGIIEENELTPIVLVWPEWGETLSLLKQITVLYDKAGYESYRTRLIQFLCVWGNESPSDFSGEALSVLQDFIQRLLNDKNDATQARYGTLISNTLNTSQSSLDEYGYTGGYEAVISSALIGFKGPVSQLCILDFDIGEIARQMTLFTHRLYFSIPRTEFLNDAFLEPKISPNLYKFGEWFNNLTLYIGGEITTTVNAKRRVKMIVQFIQLAKQFRDQKNFHGLFSTITGLSQFSVARLKQTWKMVPHSTMNLYHSLAEMLSPSSNFKNLRVNHDQCVPPCVPTSIVLIRDLVTMSEGYKKINEKTNSLNFQKFQLLGKYLERIQDTQHCFYAYSAVSVHQSYLQHILQNPPTPEALEAASFKIEPRHSQLT